MGVCGGQAGERWCCRGGGVVVKVRGTRGGWRTEVQWRRVVVCILRPAFTAQAPAVIRPVCPALVQRP